MENEELRVQLEAMSIEELRAEFSRVFSRRTALRQCLRNAQMIAAILANRLPDIQPYVLEMEVEARRAAIATEFAQAGIDVPTTTTRKKKAKPAPAEPQATDDDTEPEPAVPEPTPEDEEEEDEADEDDEDDDEDNDEYYYAMERKAAITFDSAVCRTLDKMRWRQMAMCVEAGIVPDIPAHVFRFRDREHQSAAIDAILDDVLPYAYKPSTQAHTPYKRSSYVPAEKRGFTPLPEPETETDEAEAAQVEAVPAPQPVPVLEAATEPEVEADGAVLDEPEAAPVPEADEIVTAAARLVAARKAKQEAECVFGLLEREFEALQARLEAAGRARKEQQQSYAQATVKLRALIDDEPLPLPEQPKPLPKPKPEEPEQPKPGEPGEPEEPKPKQPGGNTTPPLVPPAPEPEQKPEICTSDDMKREIYISSDEKITLRQDYDADVTRAIKAIPGRTFDRGARTWTFPSTSAAHVLKLAAEWDFTFRGDAEAVLCRFVERADEVKKQQAEQRARAFAESKAHDANLEIEGLGMALFSFQVAGVKYALDRRRTFLADAPGLGKTAQALATAQAANAFPILVVCPASVKLNWQREALKWLPGRTVQVVSKSDANLEADIVIINYDRLHTTKTVLAARKWAALVLDESHYLKNQKAKRTITVEELAREQDIDMRLLLSGTPVLNRPGELISQLRIMGRLDSDFGGFRKFGERYCGGWEIMYQGATNLKELNRKLRETCYVRREKADVLPELPPKMRNVVAVALSNRGDYNAAERNLVAFLRKKATEDKKFLATIAHLTQREKEKALHEQADSAEMKALRAQILLQITTLRKVCAQGKLQAANEWISNFLDTGEKLVVFGHHQEIVQGVADSHDCDTIAGSDDAQTRQAAVDRFQTEAEARVISCNLKAGGEGITLTAASNTCFIELGWNPGQHEQAEDRVHRIGQMAESVTAWYLLAENTIDDWMWDLIETKRTIVDAATQGLEVGKEDEGVMSAAMRHYLT